jgi:hypothetical protein
VKGRIRDTSRVTGPDGKEIEVLEWSERPDGSLKHKTIRSAIRGGDLPDSCKVLPESTCIRPTGETLRVLRKLTPGLRATYNRHLRDGDFGGRISVMMKIGPAGKIEYLYLIGNTTGRHRFALEILRHLNAWTFSPNDNDMFELVTVPFDFSQ